jgi:5-formyltetrahydrofolate cyclo-ligase
MHFQKKELRKLIKTVLKTIEPSEKEHQSRVIENYLLKKSNSFKNSQHIGIYLSQNEQEIDTTSLIQNILINHNSKKSIYVPHIDFLSNSNEMKFYHVKTLDQLENQMTTDNKYKLKQFKDNYENLVEVNPKSLDLILVPAMAFTIESLNKVSRLGRGKGYYDRYLSAIPSCHTIGLAFNEQLIPNELIDSKTPFDENLDICLKEVLCEKLIKY